MADGSKKYLGKIVVGDWVLGYDGATNQIVPKEVEQVWDNPSEKVYRYYLSNRRVTDSTASHEMMTPEFVKKPIGECTHILDENLNPVEIIKVRYLGEIPVYDIGVKHEYHDYICDGLITGNSGKSQILRREVAWMFERNHPHFVVPDSWDPDEPWTILLVGKTRRMLEDSLWPGIRKFLKPGTYKEVKAGPYLEKIENIENGNKIILLSHDNPAVAVDRMQSFTAHYVGLDEMPTHYKIIEELHRRGQVKGAPFLASFTPKSVNMAIKKLVDAVEFPHGKVYKLRSLDNPALTEKNKTSIIESIKSYSASYKRTILEGDWMIGEKQVYEFHPEHMVAEPTNYSKTWRHIESSDPALQSKFGFTLWAEEPRSGIWYCVRAEYIEGVFDPVLVFKKVMEMTEGYNIVKRVCDPHEAWYLHTASTHGVHYTTPFNKNSRKGELIKGLQASLMSEVRIAPWCEDLIEEFSTCQWSETVENKIVNSSSFHLLDTAQYFVDCKPPFEPSVTPNAWWVTLREENKKRKVAEHNLKKQVASGRVSFRARNAKAWSRRQLRSS
jgi:hypothetical protein